MTEPVLNAVIVSGPAEGRDQIVSALTDAGYAVTVRDSGLRHAVVISAPIYRDAVAVAQATAHLPSMPVLAVLRDDGEIHDADRDIFDRVIEMSRQIVDTEEAFVSSLFGPDPSDVMGRLFGETRDRISGSAEIRYQADELRKLTRSEFMRVGLPERSGFDHRAANQAPRSQRRGRR